MLTILWHNTESAGYTDHIPTKWLSRDGAPKKGVHYVIGPDSRPCKAKCRVIVREKTIDLDYGPPFDKFNKKNGMEIGVMRIEFVTSSRDSVPQVSWKDEGKKKRFKSYDTTVTLMPDALVDFEAEVDASSKLTSKERSKRLAFARKRPMQVRTVAMSFRRNPDVVAEVLFRANGICQGCKKPAPFNRADTGVPYLEVHHKKRLGDGGNDTVKNAIAVCPNCHRKAHYG